MTKMLFEPEQSRKPAPKLGDRVFFFDGAYLRPAVVIGPDLVGVFTLTYQIEPLRFAQKISPLNPVGPKKFGDWVDGDEIDEVIKNFDRL
jgi:hypothetical protein